jgi:hypothetical protein
MLLCHPRPSHHTVGDGDGKARDIRTARFRRRGEAGTGLGVMVGTALETAGCGQGCNDAARPNTFFPPPAGKVSLNRASAPRLAMDRSTMARQLRRQTCGTVPSTGAARDPVSGAVRRSSRKDCPPAAVAVWQHPADAHPSTVANRHPSAYTARTAGKARPHSCQRALFDLPRAPGEPACGRAAPWGTLNAVGRVRHRNTPRTSVLCQSQ